MHIRDALPADFPRILELNEESVHFLSALTPQRLALLHGQSARHRVVEQGGCVVAFLLVFREGSAYDSPNYRWFAQRYPRFLYIDRVVVSAAAHGKGMGKALYGDLIALARATGVPLVTCEIDIAPPNPNSARFHAAFGFVEAGTQFYGVDNKQVSLQVLQVAAG